MAIGQQGLGQGHLGALGKAGTTAAPFLPLWNAALTARAAGTRNAKLLFVGDSTTAGWGGQGTASHANDLRWSVPRRMVPYLPYGSDTSFFADHNTLTGLGGTINLATFDSRIVLGGWTQSLTNTPTVGGRMLTNSSSTTPLTFTTQYAVDTFDIYTRTAPGLGTFTAQIGSGGLTSIIQNAAAGILKTTVTGTLGRNTLNLAWVSGSCDLIGVIGYNSAQKECSIYNAGFSGSVVADWTPNVNAYDPLSMVQTLAPDLTIVNLTINDWVAATNTTTYTNGLQAIITAAKVSGDVILMSGVPSNTTSASSAQQLTYINICQSLATSNSIPFVNMTAQWTDYATSNANGWMFDSLHPNGTGYNLIPPILASAMQLTRSYTAEAQAIFAAFTTPPSDARKRIISFATEMLKQSTCWADLDRLGVVAAADSQASLVDWINPAKSMRLISAPTFVADRGFTSAGTGSAIGTNFTPSVDGVKYTQNNASVWVWSQTAADQVSASGADVGNGTTTPLALMATRNSSGSASYRINDATGGSVAVADGSGLFAIQRTGATARKMTRNGTTITSDATASTGLPPQELYFGASNGATVIGSHQESVFAAGASLNGKELVFLNCLLVYMQEIGAWVIF